MHLFFSYQVWNLKLIFMHLYTQIHVHFYICWQILDNRTMLINLTISKWIFNITTYYYLVANSKSYIYN